MWGDHKIVSSAKLEPLQQFLDRLPKHGITAKRAGAKNESEGGQEGVRSKSKNDERTADFVAKHKGVPKTSRQCFYDSSDDSSSSDSGESEPDELLLKEFARFVGFGDRWSDDDPNASWKLVRENRVSNIIVHGVPEFNVKAFVKFAMKHAVKFAIKYNLQQSRSFAISAYGEDVARCLGTEYARKCQFFYDIYIYR